MPHLDAEHYRGLVITLSLPKLMNMISTDDHHKLILFLCCTIIDLILILMVYVHNVKEFTGEKAIS